MHAVSTYQSPGAESGLRVRSIRQAGDVPVTISPDSMSVAFPKAGDLAPSTSAAIGRQDLSRLPPGTRVAGRVGPCGRRDGRACRCIGQERCGDRRSRRGTRAPEHLATRRIESVHASSSHWRERAAVLDRRALLRPLSVAAIEPPVRFTGQLCRACRRPRREWPLSCAIRMRFLRHFDPRSRARTLASSAPRNTGKALAHGQSGRALHTGGVLVI
jgi:hypothetical protein